MGAWHWAALVVGLILGGFVVDSVLELVHPPALHTERGVVHPTDAAPPPFPAWEGR